MKRIDLLKLRKSAGLSQKQLADRLAVQPSFLSAIEKGRSRFPDEKIEKLKEIFLLESLEDFMIEDAQEITTVPPHSHTFDEGDSLSHLLRHIHNLAHKNDDMEKGRETQLLERINYLSVRNDRLSDRLDDLRDKIDKLREENFRLKDILRENRIEY